MYRSKDFQNSTYKKCSPLVCMYVLFFSWYSDNGFNFITILDHTAAILKNHRMSFNLKGLHHVEPAYAGLVESPGSEVHGVAFCMSKESVEELDNTERGYDKKMVNY